VGYAADRARAGTELVVLAVFFEGFFGRIPAVDVALVVGVVMPRQNLFADVRLKGVILVRKGVEFVAHMYFLHSSVLVESC